jgi:hypothetical protein
MRSWLAGCSVLVALAASTAAGGGEARARSLRLEPAWFDGPEIVAGKSLPPQFELVLEREAPTPGYAFEIDSLDVNPAERRIRVRFTEKRPEGLVAQVITPTRMRVELGALEPGAYVLELWLRRGDGYEPVQALVLSAR